MNYMLHQHYMYSQDTDDVTVDLGNLKFCENDTWKTDNFETHSIWAVIENASSEENRKLIEGFENVCNLITYELPFDVVIVSIYNVEFPDGKMPEIITEDEMNEKLKNVRENAVWVDLLIPEMKILTVYRMSYVMAPDNVVIAEIPFSTLNGEEYKFKGLNYSHNCKLNVFEAHVNDFSDRRMTKLLTGNDANVLWSSLVDEVICNSAFKPELVDREYNYNRFAEEYKDVIEYFLHSEDHIKKIDKDDKDY